MASSKKGEVVVVSLRYGDLGHGALLLEALKERRHINPNHGGALISLSFARNGTGDERAHLESLSVGRWAMFLMSD